MKGLCTIFQENQACMKLITELQYLRHISMQLFSSNTPAIPAPWSEHPAHATLYGAFPVEDNARNKQFHGKQGSSEILVNFFHFLNSMTSK